MQPIHQNEFLILPRIHILLSVEVFLNRVDENKNNSNRFNIFNPNALEPFIRAP
jgi:hypothetical protein